MSHIYKSKRLVHKKLVTDQKSSTSHKIFPVIFQKSVVDINFHTTKNFNLKVEPVLMKKFSEMNIMSKKNQFLTRKNPNNFVQGNRNFNQVNSTKKMEINNNIACSSSQKLIRNRFQSSSKKNLIISEDDKKFSYADKTKVNRKLIPLS